MLTPKDLPALPGVALIRAATYAKREGLTRAAVYERIKKGTLKAYAVDRVIMIPANAA